MGDGDVEVDGGVGVGSGSCGGSPAVGGAGFHLMASIVPAGSSMKLVEKIVNPMSARCCASCWRPRSVSSACCVCMVMNRTNAPIIERLRSLLPAWFT